MGAIWQRGWVFAFIEFSRNLRAEYMKSYCRKGAYTPGIKTADQPVVLDGGDAVDGFVGGCI
jgi:hypothetical protein